MQKRKLFVFLLTLCLGYITPVYALSQQVITFFAAPGDDGTWGLTWDGNYLWSASSTPSQNELFRLDTLGNVVSSFIWGNDVISGLTFDGTYLWIAESNSGNLCQVTTSGTLIKQLSTGLGEVAGLGWDGSYLWVIDRATSTVNQIDTDGNLISNFLLPGTSTNPTGLTWDGAALWFCDADLNQIYEISDGGQILQQFAGPGLNATELSWDGQYLWVSDIVTDRIYKVAVSPSEPSSDILYTWIASSIDGALAPPPYGLRLDGFFDKDKEETATFAFDDVTFQEYADGTARLFGIISVAEVDNCGGPGSHASSWDMDVYFFSVPVPSGHDQAWRYYMIDPSPCPGHKEMVNRDDDKEYVQLWSFPADSTMPFQVGFGANEKNDNFGAAGWLNYSHVTKYHTYGGGKYKHIESSDFLMDLDSKTAVAPGGQNSPRRFGLLHNFPNPFNATTSVKFYMNETAEVELSVYNIVGQKVRTLVKKQLGPGEKQFVWDGSDENGRQTGTGIYFYRLVSGESVLTGKMALIK
ncbi:MAG: T9SS type A sorting domain-containing protein [candidate division Zixibacteria bacterium]|nr:T9SS type A sorting domain-containing protein [candidate division Zixibacteria bacterium]